VKAETAVNRMSILANTICGLLHVYLRHLFCACILPALIYVSPAWWTEKKFLLKPLECIQCWALQLICAAFRTTPIWALDIEASILLIKFYLDLLQKQAVIRLNKLSVNNPTIERLSDDW
jgi:hypothetical protein